MRSSVLERLSHLEPKHITIIAGFLMATAAVVGGLDHWADLLKPSVVAGLIVQIATLISAVFAGAPVNPNLTPVDNPGRREGDVPLGSVSDATRRTL